MNAHNKYLFILCFFLLTYKLVGKESDTLLANNLLNKAIYLHENNGPSIHVIELLNQAGNIYINHNLQSRYLQTQNKIIFNYLNLSKYTEAKKVIDRAYKFATSNMPTNDISLAVLNNRIGFYYKDIGHYDSAMQFLSKNLRIDLSYNDNSKKVLTAAHNSISLIHSQLGNYNEAIFTIKNAIRILNTFNKIDTFKLTTYLNNIGIYYRKIGNIDSSIYYYKHALQIHELTNNKYIIDIGRIYINLSKAYETKGDYKSRLEYLKQALIIFNNINETEKNHYSIVCYFSFGTTYVKLNQLEKAAQYHQKALSLRKALYKNVHPDVGNSYYELGIIYRKMNRLDSAMRYFESSLRTRKAIFEHDHPDIGRLYREMAKVYHIRGQYKLAQSYLEDARAIFLTRFGSVHPELGETYLVMGEQHESLQNHTKALEAYQQAMKAVVEGFDFTKLSQNPSLKLVRDELLLLHALQHKADLAFKVYQQHPDNQNYLKICEESFKKAISLIDSLQKTYVKEESRADFQAKIKPIFEGALHAVHEKYKLTDAPATFEQAFALMEKSKAVLLLMALQETKGRTHAGIPDSLMQLEVKGRRAISLQKRKLFDLQQKGDSVQIEAQRAELFEAEQKYNQLVEQLEQDYPQYYDMKYQNTLLSLEQLRAMMNPKSAILEYFLGDSVVYGLCINDQQAQFMPLGSAKELIPNIMGLRDQISSTAFLKDPMKARHDFITVAHALYKQLIQPFDASLHDIAELVIIPDGAMGMMPFETLLTKPPAGPEVTFKAFDYLLRDYLISYVNSALVWKHTFQKPNKNREIPNKGFLAIAPSYELDQQNQSNPNRGNYADSRGVLLPLKWAQQEVKAISKNFTAKILENAEASEAKFKENVSHFRGIHIASHAIVNEDNPLFSKIMFSIDEDTLGQGILYAYELYNLNLNADLTVLSACNTGSGKVVKGEGVINLARGFLYAGSASVIMTLWASDDKSTATLMESFYEELANGKAKNEALRNTKLQYLLSTNDVKSHPYYWAHFIANGNMRSFHKPFPKILFAILGTAPFLLILLLWWWKKRKVRN